MITLHWAPLNSDTCATRLQAIDHASSLIGIPLSPDKCVGHTTCLVFLGIELDSLHMTARLPEDKHVELIQILDKWASKRWCKLKELQSLVGQPSHACAVVLQGSTFVCRLLDLLKCLDIVNKHGGQLCFRELRGNSI